MKSEQKSDKDLDELIAFVWTKIELLEARKSLVPEQMQKTTAKGKGKGKGGGGKGKGAKGDSSDEEDTKSRSSGGRGGKQSFNRKTFVCFAFRDTGKCRFGEHCQYSHDVNQGRPEVRAVEQVDDFVIFSLGEFVEFFLEFPFANFSLGGNFRFSRDVNRIFVLLLLLL